MSGKLNSMSPQFWKGWLQILSTQGLAVVLVLYFVFNLGHRVDKQRESLDEMIQIVQGK